MKKVALLAALMAVIAVIAAPVASAHTTVLTVVATCHEETGTYTLVWTLTSSNLDTSPKVVASDRAAIPVGAALGATTTFTEVVAGTTVSASAAVGVHWTDGVNRSATASTGPLAGCSVPTPPPLPVCPPGYSPNGSSNGVLLCTQTITPPAPPPVFGKPVCPPGSVQSAAGDGYVVCTITTPAPPAPPVTVIKYGKPVCPVGTKTTKTGKGYVVCSTTVTKTIIKQVKYCPVPLPCPPGMHKIWDSKAQKYVCAVMGSG